MKKLQIILQKRKLSYAEVARTLGFSRVTVHDQAKRGIQTIKTAKKYAAALGVDWQELID